MQSELLEHRPRPRVQLSRTVELAAHRLQLGQHAEDRRLGLAVAVDALGDLPAVLDADVDRRRSVDDADRVLGRSPPLLPQVAGAPRTVDRVLQRCCGCAPPSRPAVHPRQ